MTVSRSSYPASSMTVPDFSFRLSDQDTTNSNTSSGYSTPTPTANMESWSYGSASTPEIKSMDYSDDHDNGLLDDDQDYLQVQPRSHQQATSVAEARARTAAVTTATTVAISSSTAPQYLNSQQYVTMMNEAAGRIRALAEEQQQHPSSAVPFSTPSPNTLMTSFHTEDYRRQMNNMHPYQQYQHRHSPYSASQLAAVRRTHSMDSTSHVIPFSLNSSMSNNTSSPGSPMLVLHSQAPFHKSNNNNGLSDDPSQHNDYFMSSTDLNMGLGMNMMMTTNNNHHLSGATTMPMTINHQRRNTDPMYYPSSSFSSNLSSSFLSSSSSASPSPTPPSPVMLSSSPSSLGLPCHDRKRLSIISTASSAPSLRSSSNDGIKKAKARYVCHYPNCHRTFSRPFNLKSHGLTHETQRPHACDQCPKTFARVHDRDRHAKGHLTEKAHSCIVCQGRFARQDAVTRHLKLANEQNPCAVILKTHGISFREAAAGRVQRSALGDETVIRKTLESLEEQARKLRATKNLEMGMMSMGVNMNSINAMGLSHVNMNNMNAAAAAAATAAAMSSMGMGGMNMNMSMGLSSLGHHHQHHSHHHHTGPGANAAGSVNGLTTMASLGGYGHAELEHAFR